MRKTKNNYVPAEYGGYMFPKSCLPDILPGDRGKVLTVNQDETEAIWARCACGMVVYVNDPVYAMDGMLLSGVLDHTWNQINNALRNGIPVQIVASNNVIPGDFLTVLHIQTVAGVIPIGYSVVCYDGNTNIYEFLTDDASGYPEISAA